MARQAGDTSSSSSRPKETWEDEGYGTGTGFSGGGLRGEKQKTRLGLESGSAEGIQAALGRSLRIALITIVAGPTHATRRV